MILKKIKSKNVKMVSIRTLFKESDFISVHVHLNDKTIGLVDKKLMKLMKRLQSLLIQAEEK